MAEQHVGRRDEGRSAETHTVVIKVRMVSPWNGVGQRGHGMGINRRLDVCKGKEMHAS